MDYLNFAVEHPVVAGVAVMAITFSICLILSELAGVVAAARGKSE